MSDPLPRSTNSGNAVVVGSVEPRIWTPPLRELTPETSYGHDVIAFARDVLGTPLDPWQQWVAIHVGELLPDGRPRFRTALVIVGRQNGKSLLAKVLILYWLFVESCPLVLGTSTDRSYAKRTWAQVCDQAKRNPLLAEHLGPGAVRLTIGEESLTTLDAAEYTFAANNGRAGRSTTLHRWVCDELREHKTLDAWNAATFAQNAVPEAQTIAVTNQGDADAIALDALRIPALEYLATGRGDARLGIFEYSSPAGSRPTDLAALAMSNPNLGVRVDQDALLGAAARAEAAGGEELTSFLTEIMCIKVDKLDPAIDPGAWEACGTDTPLSLAEHRGQVALCVDVSLAADHASLVAAAVIDGTVHVEVIEQWVGHGCTRQLRAELPAIVEKVKPRVLGWFPTGPAAAVAADLADRGARNWPPRRVKIEEIRAEVTQVCMGLADAVLAGDVAHPKDELLDQHVGSTGRTWRGDGAWVFTRRGASAIDAAYATAGAVHLARTLPPAPPPLVAL